MGGARRSMNQMKAVMGKVVFLLLALSGYSLAAYTREVFYTKEVLVKWYVA